MTEVTRKFRLKNGTVVERTFVVDEDEPATNDSQPKATTSTKPKNPEPKS